MFVKEIWGQKEYSFSLQGICFYANVHFEAKLSEVVGKEGDHYFGVGTRFKNKLAFIYIHLAEYIEESERKYLT